MRWIYWILCLAGFSLGCADGVEPGDDLSEEVYDAANLPRFDLTIPGSSLRSLEFEPYTYVPASLTYNQTTVENLGVRLKGRTSFQPIDGKPAFKIRFDKYIEEQTFLGLRGMTLNNSVRDPSHMAERLAYRVFRATGIPAPRANNALVYVNGEFFGVYVNLETEDKTFLARWFSDDGGNLYEVDFGDISPGPVERFELETNQDENDHSDLEELLAALEGISADTLLEDLDPFLDMDQLLRYCAAEAITLQPDGYAFLLWGDDMPGNYRLYHDPASDRFHIIPWSMDLAMKPPHMHVRNVSTYIMYSCTQSESCQSRYDDACAELANVFESLSLEEEVNRIREQIGPYIEMGSRSQVDPATFEAEVARVIEAARDQPQLVRNDLADPWKSHLTR